MKRFYQMIIPISLCAAGLFAGCASAPAPDGTAASDAAPDIASSGDASYKDTWFGGGYATLGPEAAAVCDVIFRSDGTCSMTLSESPGSGTVTQSGTYNETASSFTFLPFDDSRPSILGYEPGYTFIKHDDVLLMTCESYDFTSNDGGATLSRDSYWGTESYAFHADTLTYDYVIDGERLRGAAYTAPAPGIIMFENPGERGGVMWRYFVFMRNDTTGSSWTGYHCYTLWRRDESGT